MRKVGFVLAALSSLLISCLALATPTQNVDEIVQATFQALTAQAPGSTFTPETAQTGSISGSLGYPSEAIPPLRVAALGCRTGLTRKAGPNMYWSPMS